MHLSTTTGALVLGLAVLASASACTASGGDEGDDAVTAPLRQVAAVDTDATPIVLSTSDGSACRVTPKARAQARAVLAELASAPARSVDAKLLQDPFARSAARLDAEVLEACAPELQDWALQSFAQRRLAPYDVAAVHIPRMAELRLFLSGGGILAGLMGDGVGAACMSAIGAGLEYAQTRGWVSCTR